MPREMVGNWLYGVAHQTAVRLRATAAKRGVREIQMMEMPEPVVAEVRGDDLLMLLDQELSCLPEKYRVLIVLCDLESKTRIEVARQLAIPEGTVASRLARARGMLAKRLARHGLAVSSVSLAATLSQTVASATVPTSVVSSTINVATLLAAGKAVGVISGPVAALTEGVLKTMFLKKIMTTTVVLLALTVAAVTFGSLAKGQTEGADTVKDGAGKPVPLRGVALSGEMHTSADVTLAPGKEVELYEWKSQLRPASDRDNKNPNFFTLYGTGKFSVQYERVLGNSTASAIEIDPVLSKLATGKLELEVKEAEKPKENDPKAEKDDAKTSLAGAIRSLNTKASADPVGKDETPITEQEVIAAIRAAGRPKDSAVTDKLFDAFKKIAETKQLPPGAELEAVGGSHDPGSSFIYDVWWVRVRMPKEANGTYGFVIRERIIRSRTLQEEAARLEKELSAEGEPLVDGGRTQERIDDLKARIEKMKTK